MALSFNKSGYNKLAMKNSKIIPLSILIGILLTVVSCLVFVKEETVFPKPCRGVCPDVIEYPMHYKKRGWPLAAFTETAEISHSLQARATIEKEDFFNKRWKLETGALGDIALYTVAGFLIVSFVLKLKPQQPSKQ